MREVIYYSPLLLIGLSALFAGVMLVWEVRRRGP